MSSPSERTIRSQYRHLSCGTVTDIGMEVASTFAYCPKFYKRAYCQACEDHFYLRDGEKWQFFWTEDGEPVGMEVEEARIWHVEHPKLPPPELETIEVPILDAPKGEEVADEEGSCQNVGENVGNGDAATTRGEKTDGTCVIQGSDGSELIVSPDILASAARAEAIYKRTVINNPYIRKDMLRDGKPHPRQEIFLLETDKLEVFYGGAAGGGKAVDVCTPIQTIRGWKTIGEIEIGDQVFDERGDVCEVVGCSEIMLNRQCYELTFTDGVTWSGTEKIIADAEHLWPITTFFSEKYLVPFRRNIPTRDIFKNFGDTHYTIHARGAGFGIVAYRHHDIISIQPCASVPVRCIAVSSPSHCYLAGRAMIPTHNSLALLMAALQFVETPGYAALILRNSFRDLNQPGSLIPVSKKWLMNFGGTKWNARDRRWTFPSGATLTFGYLERYDDALQYRSSEFQCICFDELTLFGQEEYLYLFSRLRKTKDLDVPLRLRSGSNPGAKGAAWVRERFILPHTQGKEVLFVPAKIADNPSLSREEYEKNLKHLDPITRRQLMEGDWEASEEGRFKMAWFRNGRFKHDPAQRGIQLCNHDADYGGIIPLNRCSIFITVDLAASVKTSADYTVFLACAVTPWQQLLILDMERKHFPVEQIPYNLKLFVDRIRQQYEYWPMWAGIEGNGLQIGIANACREQPGMVPVRYLRPENQDKLARANKAIIMAEQGRIFLPLSASFLDNFLYELIQFTGDPKKDSHDDVVDCLSYACANITTGLFEAPSFGGRERNEDGGKDSYGGVGRKLNDGMNRVWSRDGRMRRLFGN